MHRPYRLRFLQESPFVPNVMGLLHETESRLERQSTLFQMEVFRHVVIEKITSPILLPGSNIGYLTVIDEPVVRVRSSKFLTTIAADPKHLWRRRSGISSGLHTWGSALTHKTHVHH